MKTLKNRHSILFVGIVTLIFSAEALVMLILPSFPSSQFGTQAILDALLLTTILSPIVYLFLLKPLLLSKHKLKKLQNHKENVNKTNFSSVGTDEVINVKELKNKLFAILAGILLLSFIGVSVMFSIIFEHKSDSNIINKAGAQRMLSQKITKDVLRLIITNKKNTHQLKTSIDRFELVLKGLENGSILLSLPACKDKQTLYQLKVIESLWLSFKSKIDTIILKDDKSGTEIEDLLYTSQLLLDEVDAAVKLFEHLSTDKVERMKFVQLGIVSFTSVLIILSWVFLIVPLTDSFREMLDVLKMRTTEMERAKIVAERANEIKSNFLANMSHEIRTPMNGIMGFTNILMESNPTEEQMEFLEIIQKSSNNLLEIINDILDISKVEAEKITLEEVEFDIENIAHDVCNLIRFKVNNGIEVFANIGNIPKMLLGDATKLRQIITNLMGNASKFTKSGKIILNVSLLKEKDGIVEIEFSVKDTGIGIPKEKLNLIFRPFTQADDSITRKFGGTGLGLSISLKFSELMGGRMWVESESGKGSIFYFTAKFKKVDSYAQFPKIKAGKLHCKHTNTICPVVDIKKSDGINNNVKQNNNKEILRGTHILVAEDNKINQKLMIKMLTTLGCKVGIAENGRIALNKLKEEKNYSIVFMDIQMPEMDGISATKEIRSIGISVPIIAMTANAMKGDRETCINAGMNDYIAKPIQKNDVIAKIQQWRIAKKDTIKLSK